MLKKCLLVLISVPSSIIIAVGIDIALSGSVYHPLTYLFNISSWLECKTLSSICDKTKLKTSLPFASGKNGAVVTEQHIASEVGLQILKEGGNAVDAAVAVGYALAVVDPCCGNIGGGGFMIVHWANGKDIFIDFREKAPLAAKANMYLDKQGKVISGLSTKGYLAVAVPGTVLGLDRALSEYGTMTRKQIMAPAIELAQKGFVLQPADVSILDTSTNKFIQQSNVSAIFLKNGSKPYQAGERLVQRDLAYTLELIAQLGPDAFYKGVIADKIIKANSENKGILTKEDFANYTVEEMQPVSCNYRGYQVISAPPPGSGTTLCEMLNILDSYPLRKLGFHSALSLHYELESMLYAYSDRNVYLGDPSFVKNPIEHLLSKKYATQIQAKIPENRATSPNRLYFMNRSREGTHTTQYSIVDRYSNAVSVTYTINSFFGAEVIAGNSGFFLNNEMDDFTSKPGVPNNFGLVQGSANAIEPGKRPLSSMTPTIVTNNGKVFIVTGSPGGPTITTTVLQVIVNVIDFDMSIKEAVDAPRIHYQGLPNVVITEPYALKSNVVQNLWEMGYQVAPFFTWGASESILVNPKTGLLHGANDSRRPAGASVAY